MRGRHFSVLNIFLVFCNIITDPVSTVFLTAPFLSTQQAEAELDQEKWGGLNEYKKKFDNQKTPGEGDFATFIKGMRQFLEEKNITSTVEFTKAFKKLTGNDIDVLMKYQNDEPWASGKDPQEIVQLLLNMDKIPQVRRPTTEGS